jgi:hypothetical protein
MESWLAQLRARRLHALPTQPLPFADEGCSECDEGHSVGGYGSRVRFLILCQEPLEDEVSEVVARLAFEAAAR